MVPDWTRQPHLQALRIPTRSSSNICGSPSRGSYVHEIDLFILLIPYSLLEHRRPSRRQLTTPHDRKPCLRAAWGVIGEPAARLFRLAFRVMKLARSAGGRGEGKRDQASVHVPGMRGHKNLRLLRKKPRRNRSLPVSGHRCPSGSNSQSSVSPNASPEPPRRHECLLNGWNGTELTEEITQYPLFPGTHKDKAIT